MIQILIVSSNKQTLTGFASSLEELGNTMISWAGTGAAALDAVSKEKCDLVVADEVLEDMTGLDFIRKLVTVNPMVNCVAVGGLTAEDFHEASEGLGVLMQLPPSPGKADADKLMQSLNDILALTSSAKGK